MSGAGFLGRWSRRKRAVAEGLAPDDGPAAPALAAPPAAPAVPASPGVGPAEVAFDPATLPPVESLTAESDVTGFLRRGVPAPLRNAAMRRAWSLDPVIRDYIGPADYAWDFNAPDTIPGFSATLGGDLAKLIAQATGHPLPPEPGEPEGAEGLSPEPAGEGPVGAPSAVPVGEDRAVAGNAPSLPAPDAAEATHPGSALRRTDAAEGPAASVADARPADAHRTDARAAVLAAPPEVSNTVRRRHGGAVPV